MQLFIKSDVLTKCTSGTVLKQLDLTKKDNFQSRSKLNIGFATELTVSEVIRRDLVTDTEVSLFERSPLGSMIVKHARCLDPKYFGSNKCRGINEASAEAFSIFKGDICYHWE